MIISIFNDNNKYLLIAIHAIVYIYSCYTLCTILFIKFQSYPLPCISFFLLLFYSYFHLYPSHFQSQWQQQYSIYYIIFHFCKQKLFFNIYSVVCDIIYITMVCSVNHWLWKSKQRLILFRLLYYTIIFMCIQLCMYCMFIYSVHYIDNFSLKHSKEGMENK